MTDHAPPPPAADSPEFDPADDALLTFTPVPTRTRRDGWTPARQRAFIAALRRTGQVALAAREVGMSHQSARGLRKRPGAESLVAAWELALNEARSEALDQAIERATLGVFIPRSYRGRFVRMEHRYDDGALIAALRHSYARAPGS